MLVLSRKAGEQIWIGSAIQVTVLAIQGGRVRLGFAGSPEIPIHREEVHRRLGADKAAPRADRAASARDAG